MGDYYRSLENKTSATLKIKKWVRKPLICSTSELDGLSALHPLEVREIFKNKKPSFYETYLKSQVEDAIVKLGLDENNKVKVDKYLVTRLWIEVVVIALLGCYISNSWRYFHLLPTQGNVPYTFSFAWILLSYFLIYRILRKIKFTRDKMIYFGFLFMLGLGLYEIVSRVLVFPGKPRFVGVYSNVSSETDYDGRYDEKEVNVTPFVRHKLFKVEDENWLSDVYGLEKKNDIVDVQPFIFWQTGLSENYLPTDIRSYNDPVTFFDKLELYLTVGPLVIVESLIVGIYKYIFCFLLIYFAFHFYIRWKSRSDNIDNIDFKIPIIITNY